MLSGIGPAEHLPQHGIEVLVDNVIRMQGASLKQVRDRTTSLIRLCAQRAYFVVHIAHPWRTT
jgi:hypothetical protein